mmetsp:Transcript_86615/g.129874  ORF Transcript_86615/g.129874 Transcript_86615/m.129874 type:complete len:244 (-) Transcript_86615:194-925(-)
MTSTTSTPSKSIEDHAPLLEIHSPVGTHGDAVLGLQVNYANNATVRRRLVEDITRSPVGGDKGDKDTRQRIQRQRERAKSFLTLSEKAVTQASPTLSLQALQEVAQIENDEILLFSVVSAHAKVALLQLENPENDRVVRAAKDNLQARLRRRMKIFTAIALLAPPLVAFMCYLDQYSQGNSNEPAIFDDPVQVVFIGISYVFVLFLGHHTLRQREFESKQLVQELYMLASSQKPQRQQQQQQV